MSDPSGNVTANLYADSSFPTLEVSSTNALDATTAFWKDPVSTTSSCSTSPSSSNTVVTRTYDSEGRLSTVTDWLGNTTTYGYTEDASPYATTSITYPTATGVSAAYGYSNSGNLTSLSASSTVTSGTAISDGWTQNADEQVATSSVNSSTSATESYNANAQVTSAANLASSSSDDVYTIAANGEITSDTPPTGSATSFAYNAGDELCAASTTSTSASCSSTPSTGEVYTYTTNGQRASATPYASGTAGASTTYTWNAYGELCNVASSSTACGTTPSSGTSYSYNGQGLRISATTASSTTDFSWDSVSGGDLPLDLNDATTTSSGTTNTSYLYGNLLFGGTAPIEQITTSSSGTSVSYLVSNPTGVQGVYSGNASSLGAVQEMAIYSVYGVQSIASGSDVTPFGFQGSYTDPTGLVYLIHRYYDPATDQFLSVDPDVQQTDQPYVFTNDDPLNRSDPSGWYAAALMEGGYQTLQQQAATINSVLDSQLGNAGSPSGVTPFVTVVSNGNSKQLVDILTPDNGHGAIYVSVLDSETKSVGRSNSLQDAGALLTSFGAATAGLGSPLLNTGEGFALIGGSEILGAVGLAAVTIGGVLVVAGLAVLVSSIW